MAADYPDVLDHLGKTPREFGSVHVHVEPVPRAEDGTACATVWAQCAFEPLPTDGVIEVHRRPFTLPKLAGGDVWKGRLPLGTLPADTAELMFMVTCRLLPKSERVRQAWLLFATREAPRPLGGGGGGFDGAGGLLLANLVTLPLGVAVIPTGGFVDSGDDGGPGKVHPAMKLPPGFVAKVVSGEPARITDPTWDLVWRPGQSLPPAETAAWGNAPATDKPVLTGASLRRSCSGCGFSGRREDFSTEKSCPACGYPWD